MEASKAEEIATSPDELQDLQDDQLIHQQPEPEPEPFFAAACKGPFIGRLIKSDY